MLKLKLQYFGHLMQRTDSLEKTLMLGKLKAGGDYMKREIPAFLPADLEDKRICTDPFGSYTGLVTDPNEKPVQDADDL